MKSYKFEIRAINNVSRRFNGDAAKPDAIELELMAATEPTREQIIAAASRNDCHGHEWEAATIRSVSEFRTVRGLDQAAWERGTEKAVR